MKTYHEQRWSHDGRLRLNPSIRYSDGEAGSPPNGTVTVLKEPQELQVIGLVPTCDALVAMAGKAISPPGKNSTSPAEAWRLGVSLLPLIARAAHISPEFVRVLTLRMAVLRAEAAESIEKATRSAATAGQAAAEGFFQKGRGDPPKN
jgi:hypothetical protein